MSNNPTKETVYENLKDFKEVMDKLGILWWLDSGLLLGLHRDSQPIDGDEDDTDVCIWQKDYVEHFNEFIAELEEKGFEHISTFDFEGNPEGAAVKRNGNKIDIIAMRKKEDKVCYYLANNSKKRLGNLDYFAFVFPAEPYKEFKTITWKDLEILAPHDIEGYLEARYGKTWKTPIIRGKGYRPFDLSVNTCLRGDWVYNNPKHLL